MEIIIRHHSEDPVPTITGKLVSVDEYYTNTVESVWELSDQQLLLAQIQLDNRYSIARANPNPNTVLGKYLKGLKNENIV
jgi:hypothetical protein